MATDLEVKTRRQDANVFGGSRSVWHQLNDSPGHRSPIAVLQLGRNPGSANLIVVLWRNFGDLAATKEHNSCRPIDAAQAMIAKGALWQKEYF